MMLVGIDSIPGKDFEVLGIVKGTIVQSKNFGRDFMAAMKTLVGGEIKGYTEMLNEAEDDEDETLVNKILEYLDEVKKVYGESSAYTFDELYELADGSGFGDPRLDAKDNARWCMECIIKEDTGLDVNECECPEDEIFSYLETHEIYFDKDGNGLLD